MSLVAIGIIVLAIIIILSAAIRILPEWERGIVLRFGRFVGIRGPGFVVLIPFVEKIVRMDLRVITMDVPSQEVITKDNVTVRVNAVAYFRVMNPNDAVNKVENYLVATSQIAQTTLRSVLGQVELDELLSNREKINQELQKIIDHHTEPWGIKVSVVEVKNVDLPPEMTRAIARQAEAERERRSKVIHAEGESQASAKLAEAALVLSKSPNAVLLRFLQTLTEVSVNKASTIVFPLPIELLEAFSSKGKPGAERSS